MKFMGKKEQVQDFEIIVGLLQDEIRMRSDLVWASTRENLSSVVCNNKDEDQPAHSRRLISAFVIRSLKCIRCRLATGE